MKIIIKILLIISILTSITIAVCSKWLEFPIIKDVLGIWLYEHIYFLYLLLNVLLIIYLLFRKDLSKKEKEHHVFMIISIPFYSIYVIISVL